MAWTSTLTLLPRRRLRGGALQVLLLCTANLGVLVLAALWIADRGPEAAAVSTLDRVLGTRQLRVGLTADYAPFALRCTGGTLGAIGSDVEAAEDLASSLGAQLQLVLTSWSDIVDDLATRRAFDIGVGGISQSLTRWRSVGFSEPYVLDGKVVVAPCGSPVLEGAASWEALRQLPSLSMAVNPGGTNERAIRAELPNVRLELVEANGEQFGLVAERRVNATVTDGIEAQLQQLRRSELCHSAPLTHSAKAYMLPRDDASWVRYVDAWLSARLRSGAANASLQRWLSRSSTLDDPVATPACATMYAAESR